MNEISKKFWGKKMDENIFLNFSGVDFFLLGLTTGALFDRFTTLVLVVFYLFATNKKIGGIESHSVLKFCYQYVKNMLPSDEKNEGEKGGGGEKGRGRKKRKTN